MTALEDNELTSEPTAALAVEAANELVKDLSVSRIKAGVAAKIRLSRV